MSEEEKTTKKAPIGGISQQRNQYRTIGGQPAKTPERNQEQPPIPQNDIPVLSQNDNIIKHEYANTAKPQRSTKTQERDKITYYLDPGQFDKLEEMRLAYKKATGTRLNEQEFMRLIIERLDLHTLL